MTSLAGINLDPNVDESTGGFVVIPANKYKACLVADELKDNSKQTGKLLVLQVQIIEGEHSGHVLKDNINITNPNPKAQAIGQGTLKRICNLCGVAYPPQDTAGLMGKPIGVDVRVEEFPAKDPAGNIIYLENGEPKKLKSNKIHSYGPVPTAPAQTAQTQQPQMQNASGW